MEIKNMSGIYIFDENKVLMMKRIKKDYNGAGEYYSIGGKFEKDELNNPYQCILRELEEETGLKQEDITHLKLKYLVLRNYDGLIAQNYIFFADLVNKKQLKECDEGFLEWVPLEEIFDLPLPASSRACLKHYFEGGIHSDDLTAAVATINEGNLEYIFTDILSEIDHKKSRM